MGIFDRLSRLARSEANHLFDSVNETAQGVLGKGAERRSRSGATVPEASADDRWPPEVREDYAALELPVGSDRAAVRDAYRDMMRRYHPDRHAGDPARAEQANEITVQIRERYERLDAYLAKREG